jgi:phosphohistidine phosphatase
MNRTLTLIRHAEALWNNPSNDHQRPLSQQGIEHACALAQELKRRSVVFDQIHSSDALRTEHTTRCLNQQLACRSNQIFIRDALYYASARTLMEIIQQLDNQMQHIAIVAHNPGLTEYCEELVGRQMAIFAPAAVVTMSLSVDDWRAVATSTCTHHQTVLL